MLRYLLEKEFKQLLRNSFIPRLFLVIPLMMILVFPFAANQEIKHLRWVVVDAHPSSLSRRLVEKIEASPTFELAAKAVSYGEAMQHIDAGRADLIVQFPPRFEQRLMEEGHSDLYLAVNAVNGTKGAMAMAYLSQVVMDFSQTLAQEGRWLKASTQPTIDVRAPSIEPRYLFNTRLDYKYYMIPAIIGMLLVLVVGYLPTFNIVGEKERGTIEQINVTPIRPLTFIFSKLIPYWVSGLFLMAYAMTLAWLVHGFAPAGALWLLALLATLFILVISSFALVVSNYSDTTQAAAFLMFFFLVVFILMSGMLTPIASMPDWAQALSTLNPFRYFMEAMRALYLKGSSFFELLPQLTALLLMAMVGGVWATLSYKKNG